VRSRAPRRSPPCNAWAASVFKPALVVPRRGPLPAIVGRDAGRAERPRAVRKRHVPGWLAQRPPSQRAQRHLSIIPGDVGDDMIWVSR